MLLKTVLSEGTLEKQRDTANMQGDNKGTTVGFERMMTFETERLRREGRR